MKRYLKISKSLILGLLLLIFSCKNNSNTSLEILPDFNSNVHDHISELCKNNGRFIGSVFEKQAANYINQQFSEIGLQSEIENFGIRRIQFRIEF